MCETFHSMDTIIIIMWKFNITSHQINDLEEVLNLNLKQI